MRTRGQRDVRTRGQGPEPGDRPHRTRGQGPDSGDRRSGGRGAAPSETRLSHYSDSDRGPGPQRPPADPGPAPRPSPCSSLLEPGWNLSFAGCGFRGLYYLGALSCLLEHVPELVHGAARFSGASCGSLVAAALAVNVPISALASELVSMAMEARLLSGGVFHPSFSLLRRARDSLLKLLPPDAHEHASRRLCVSLTRMHDGKNLLVTHFKSREELIQVLLCSCFFPIYCGFIPPTYKGECFMDGALSDNQPLCELTNTLRFSPFSGESDICPKESGFSYVQVCFGNVSIDVNTGNVHRVWTSFLPQSPQTLTQICVNGYSDALRFITDSGAAQIRRNRRTTEESDILPPELRRVLVSCSDSDPPLRPDHFSDPPLLCALLGLVLDLVLVLIRLVLLPLGLLLKLFIRLLSLCSCRSSTSNLLQRKPRRLDKNRNVTSFGEKNKDPGAA